jgi:hypothetical protein
VVSYSTMLLRHSTCSMTPAFYCCCFN